MVKIVIKTDNAAFEGNGKGPEIARILRKMADQAEQSSEGDTQVFPIMDLNGNKVALYEEK